MKTFQPQRPGWSSEFGRMKKSLGKLSGMAAPKPSPDSLEEYVELPGGRIARLSVKTGHSANLILVGTSEVQHIAQKDTSPNFTLSNSHSLGRNELDLVLPSTEKEVSLETTQFSMPDLVLPSTEKEVSLEITQHSEAMSESSSSASFQDYYSLDQIHSGDVVVACWANQPQKKDEFLLERGDMIRVIGIYNDGWATGVVIDDQMNDGKISDSRPQSQSSSIYQDSISQQGEEVKAFPLACVCLHDYWRQKMESGS